MFYSYLTMIRADWRSCVYFKCQHVCLLEIYSEGMVAIIFYYVGSPYSHLIPISNCMPMLQLLSLGVFSHRFPRLMGIKSIFHQKHDQQTANSTCIFTSFTSVKSGGKLVHGVVLIPSKTAIISITFHPEIHQAQSSI